jgi:hypothetical protein
LFWFGLLGAGFVAWTWWHSGVYRTRLSWSEKERSFWIGQEDGSIVLATLSSSDFDVAQYRGVTSGFLFERNGVLTPDVCTWKLPKPIVVKRESGDLSGVPGGGPIQLQFVSRRMEIASWLLLLFYIAVWLMALIWLQRRKARLLKLHAAPLP